MIYSFLALLVIGIILGALLAFASEKFHVEEDPRLEEVNAMLPGYNCGACGYSGCGGLANALITKELDMIVCVPIKQDAHDKIVEYLANTPGPDGETITIKD